MKLTLLGIFLIVLSSLALAHQGALYLQRGEAPQAKQVRAEQLYSRTTSLPPATGMLALAGGIGLVIFGMRRKTPTLPLRPMRLRRRS